ncbi:MAG: diadenylate cyclase [Pseudomonadota bacterium]|nr:diadenylate cyclase [Pseudomonadota bacterium]
MQPFLSFANNLRIQDVLDVIIISLMIYFLLVWFKNRASRFVLMGLSVVGAVYVVARFFQLYLTTVVLQGFFAILIFVLVVIFQEDLRRLFERLAVIGRFGGQPAVGAVRDDTEILTTTAVNLARNRIGALIVLKGKDPLERHLGNCIPLDGLISQELLESLFDPHSPGHDGAVVIAGNRITHFGCHLPLAADMGRNGSAGLRHTAALGLAERADALCIAVSEERGTISLARNERMRVLSGGLELRNELENFYRELAPEEQTASRIAVELRKNTREKVIAVALACVLWATFGYQKETVRREYAVPIEYLDVSRNFVLEEPRIREARVILSGPTQAFQLLDPGALRVVLKKADLQEGRQSIVLTSDMVKTPSNINVVAIIPPEITVTATRYLPVSIPLEPTTTGRPPRGIAVKGIEVEPAAVRVFIPSVIAPGKIKIRTAPIDFARLSEQTSFNVALRYPPGVRFPDDKVPSAVVTVKIRKKAGDGGRSR